ncbi:hypothetical protein F2P56_017462 [Juglans regia]|uniref:Muscle M-line assembly protein unc-89-like isoform X2 n=2 Tax=Juglans regia TaxID=51240 RepID=A0A2I4FPT8_JUGRE|nr:muscle M-line assembly protein unc-89-like isoform X2 [Juglans regia]KAF5461357.1 hypothetical protein F2P56_017462 [Juglans regia]
MASSDTELEEQLLQAGNKLVDPPSSVDDLLPILDHVENCLSRVEQSPTKSMQSALSPSLKALIADKLFRHSDADVKVAVASCISEITRITAPDAPYDDNQMKEIFQLLVSSFENLSDNSSRSYTKRTSILETVAKVRSCVVMLDLECDALILEMFQNFFKAVRDYHPENVFSSMETIMTLVLEESEDISLDLLTPILASVKKDNEEVLPVARKLAERVFETCAVKVKPYLMQAVKTLGISFDDYSEVVGSICQETSSAVEQNEAHATGKDTADKSKSVKSSVDEEAPEDNGRSKAIAFSEPVKPAIQSNGVAQMGENDSLPPPNSDQKQEDGHHADPSISMNASSNAEPDSLDTENAINIEHQPRQTTRRGRKFNSTKKSTEPSENTEPPDNSVIDDEMETEKLPEHKNHSEDVPSPSPEEDPPVEATGSPKNEKETGTKVSSPKTLDNESGNVAPLSPRGGLPDESYSKKAGGRLKKKESLTKEATPSADEVSEKVSEATSDLELKPTRHTGKKVPSEISTENKTPTVVDESKKESSDSEAKPLRRPAKKVDGSSKIGDGSSSKRPEDKKRRGQGKAIREKDETKSPAKADDKEMVSSPKSITKSTKDDHHLDETPKTNSKRKRTPGKENDSDYGENLVGSKIKVWWPKDRMFYDGVIDSFISSSKKHRVLYTDGDEEVLNLKKEKWEYIGGDSGSDGEQVADQPSPDPSSEMPPKKKAKNNSDEPTKQAKMDALPKKGGGASSSKSKGTSSKSGHKFREGSKVDGKSKDDFPKTENKSENANSVKSKDRTPRSGGSKSVGPAPKSGGKSKKNDPNTHKIGKFKDDNTSTPRASTKSKQNIEKTGKSKQDTPKSASLSKDKNPKIGGKSGVNGTGKMKSGSSSSKAKEREDMKDNSTDSAKVPRSTKGKSPTLSKAQGSDSKTGKKRRRGMTGK